MSNEELAIKAKDGDQNAVAELWEQVRRFAEMKAGQYFRRFSSARTPCFELDDLIQSSFIALIRAVQYFKPEQGTLLTIFDFCLRSIFNEVSGLCHGSDAFLYAISLDSPVSTEDDSTSMSEFVPDLGDGPEETVLREIWVAQLHEKLEQALCGLPPDQNEILHRRYFGGETQASIASSHGCTSSAIQAQESIALGHLRKQKRMLGLEEFIDKRTNFYLRVGIGEFSRTNTSAVEKIVLKREEKRDRLARKWLAQHRREEGEFVFENDSKGSQKNV